MLKSIQNSYYTAAGERIKESQRAISLSESVAELRETYSELKEQSKSLTASIIDLQRKKQSIRAFIMSSPKPSVINTSDLKSDIKLLMTENATLKSQCRIQSIPTVFDTMVHEYKRMEAATGMKLDGILKMISRKKATKSPIRKQLNRLLSDFNKIVFVY